MKSKKSTPVSTPTPTDHKRTKRKTMHDPKYIYNSYLSYFFKKMLKSPLNSLNFRVVLL